MNMVVYLGAGELIGQFLQRNSNQQGPEVDKLYKADNAGSEDQTKPASDLSCNQGTKNT